MLKGFSLSPALFAVFVFGTTAAITSVLPNSSFAGRGNGDELLAKADEIRNPSESYKMQVRIEGESQLAELEIIRKGDNKALIIDKTNPEQTARMMIVNNDVFSFDPTTKQALHSTLDKNLKGVISNADLVRTAWAADYEVVSKRVIAGEVQLVLNSNKKEIAHRRARLWLQANTGRPIRAEYMAPNGKTVLKTAHFEDYKELAGNLRPTKIKVIDSKGRKNQIAILAMENGDFSDQMFNPQQN